MCAAAAALKLLAVGEAEIELVQLTSATALKSSCTVQRVIASDMRITTSGITTTL